MNGRAIIVLFVFTTLVACGKGKPEMAEIAALAVKAVKIEARELPDTIEAFGSLSFRKKTDLSVSGEGVVAKLPYREGDEVRAGAVVAVLANPQVQLALSQSKDSLDSATAALALAAAKLRESEASVEGRVLGLEKSALELLQAKRELSEAERKERDQEKLHDSGGVSEESILGARFSLESSRSKIAMMEKDLEIRTIGLRDEDLRRAGLSIPKDPVERKRAISFMATAMDRAEVDAARARLSAAKTELESARLGLADLTIKTPGPGVIGARYLEEGERAKQGDKVITVMDMNDLYAVFSVPERDALRLEKGMDAVIGVDAIQAEVKGKIDLVSPVADAQSGGFSVRAALVGGLKLKPGMFVRVSVSVGKPEQAVVVPARCLVERREGTARVFVVFAGTVSVRTVALGKETGDGWVVREGLEAGEYVVESPDAGVKEGSRVTFE